MRIRAYKLFIQMFAKPKGPDISGPYNIFILFLFIQMFAHSQRATNHV